MERKSQYTILIKLPTRESKAVVSAIKKHCAPYQKFFKTITSDNGKEFAGHAKISKILKAKYYFAHPYSSHERGLNEQINGLVRQYVPKGSSMKHLNMKDMAFIMDRLNNRPRKSLGFKTPNEIINFNKNSHLLFKSWK